MKTIRGTYHNGKLTLDKPLKSKKPLKVEIKVLKEEESVIKRSLKLEDFNFQKGRDITKNLKSSLSEEVIRQRREG